MSWTLAIEEWFYIALAICVGLAGMVSRRHSYILAVGAIIVFGVAYRFYGPTFDNHSVVGRIDAVGYGCLLAYLLRREETASFIYKYRGAISGVRGSRSVDAVRAHAPVRSHLRSHPMVSTIYAASVGRIDLPALGCVRAHREPPVDCRGEILCLCELSALCWHNEITAALAQTRFLPNKASSISFSCLYC